MDMAGCDLRIPNVSSRPFGACIGVFSSPDVDSVRPFDGDRPPLPLAPAEDMRRQADDRLYPRASRGRRRGQVAIRSEYV